MQELSARDLRAVLRFIDGAWTASEADRPFTPVTLEALRRLIPCDVVSYSELHRLRRECLSDESTDPDRYGAVEVFWEIEPLHPLCRHQQAYADFSATRLSDVVSLRRMRASRVYADWFRPAGVAAELEVGIARSRVRTHNFILARSRGDFSERDRRILDLLAPHLARIRAIADVAAPAAGRGDALPLSPREAEVLELVGEGLTNAAIAERLWIAPGTVKKHLDNVYAKLGVSSRAAAVAAARRS